MPKLSIPKLNINLKDKSFIALMKIPAVFCFALGVFYWVRLVGVFHGETWRFDLMPWYWRVLACSLAVVYPVAACGIWASSKWGAVLWLMGALYEIIAFTFYSSYFGFNFWIVILQVVFLSFYGFVSYLLWANKTEKVQVSIEY